MWKDKEALKALETSSEDANPMNYPMLLLYYPLAHANAILQSKDFVEFKIDSLADIANDVWYSLDCRTDVWNDTCDTEIELDTSIRDILFSRYNIEKNKNINRRVLMYISGEFWKELDEME